MDQEQSDKFQEQGQPQLSRANSSTINEQNPLGDHCEGDKDKEEYFPVNVENKNDCAVADQA